MKVAIMQPYFMPYIGYFQLINAVDKFVIYDEIQYSKRGWINRNRILQNGKDVYISLPLKKASDYLNVNQRLLADSWLSDRKKVLNQLRASYAKAPFFKDVWPLIEPIVLYSQQNLFDFILHALKQVLAYLGIKTSLIVSSDIVGGNELTAEDKVIEICKKVNALDYINPIGGVSLYDKKRFNEDGLSLCFLQTENVNYRQFNHDFVPFLSIIDVMMFNSPSQIRDFLSCYSLQ